MACWLAPLRQAACIDPLNLPQGAEIRRKIKKSAAG
jgi:hypothetical protein